MTSQGSESGDFVKIEGIDSDSLVMELPSRIAETWELYAGGVDRLIDAGGEVCLARLGLGDAESRIDLMVPVVILPAAPSSVAALNAWVKYSDICGLNPFLKPRFVEIGYKTENRIAAFLLPDFLERMDLENLIECNRAFQQGFRVSGSTDISVTNLQDPEILNRAFFQIWYDRPEDITERVLRLIGIDPDRIEYGNIQAIMDYMRLFTIIEPAVPTESPSYYPLTTKDGKPLLYEPVCIASWGIVRCVRGVVDTGQNPTELSAEQKTKFRDELLSGRINSLIYSLPPEQLIKSFINDKELTLTLVAGLLADSKRLLGLAAQNQGAPEDRLTSAMKEAIEGQSHGVIEMKPFEQVLEDSGYYSGFPPPKGQYIWYQGSFLEKACELYPEELKKLIFELTHTNNEEGVATSRLNKSIGDITERITLDLYQALVNKTTGGYLLQELADFSYTRVYRNGKRKLKPGEGSRWLAGWKKCIRNSMEGVTLVERDGGLLVSEDGLFTFKAPDILTDEN